MKKFQKFSEAARLYAENANVVDIMYESFQQNINEFLDSLRDEIRHLVAPENFQEKITTGYRYWWLADNNLDKDSYPQLWLGSTDPSIVFPGNLVLWAISPKDSGENLKRLVEIANKSELKRYCEHAKGGPWSLFTVNVQYTEEDPVEKAAKPIADVLLELDKAR